jgi:hypothetical protein
MSYDIDIVEEVVSIYDNGSRWHGSFYDTADQSNAGATSINKVRLNSTDLSSGVSIVSNSRITIANGGIYNIAFSAQLNKSGGGTAVTEIWLQKNGNNIAINNLGIIIRNINANHMAVIATVIVAISTHHKIWIHSYVHTYKHTCIQSYSTSVHT